MRSYKVENKSIYLVFRVEIEFAIRFCVALQKLMKNCPKRGILIDFFVEGVRCADFFFQ